MNVEKKVTPIQVSIYEDNCSFLDSFSDLIRCTEGFELCTATHDPFRLLQDCREKNPDVVLVDMNINEQLGIETIRTVRNHCPETNIMALIAFEDSDRIFHALCAGANGYLLKKSPLKQILCTIEKLHRGGSLISGNIAQKTLGFFTNRPFFKKEKKYGQLSPFEVNLLKNFTMGDSYKMVADANLIRIESVFLAIYHVYKKLQNGFKEIGRPISRIHQQSLLLPG